MALWTSNNPQITGPVLSRKITNLVATCANTVVANILQKRNADAVSLLVALSMCKKEQGEQVEASHGLSQRQGEQHLAHLK